MRNGFAPWISSRSAISSKAAATVRFATGMPVRAVVRRTSSAAAARRLDQRVVDLGLGVAPVLELAALDEPTVFEVVKRGLADQPMAQIGVEGIASTFGEGLLGRRNRVRGEDRGMGWPARCVMRLRVRTMR